MTDAAEILARALNPEHWSDPRYVAHREKDIEDARVALTKVLDAVTLEWTDRQYGSYDAKSLAGEYIVYPCEGGSYRAASMEHGVHGTHPTLALAQAAALADYRARLAAALGMGEG